MQGNEAAYSSKDVACEICGKTIYEGGRWIDEAAGVCYGPCKRKLCGDCAE